MNFGPHGQHDSSISQVVGLTGSSVAIFFGILSFLWSQADPGDVLRSGPTGGLAVAAVGVITALASLLLPMAKLYFNERQHERDDRFRREDLDGKLRAAAGQIDLMKAEIAKLSNAEHARMERERSGPGVTPSPFPPNQINLP